MKELYPPINPDELKNCHSFENLTRVVVTEHHIYARTTDGYWIELKPKSQCQTVIWSDPLHDKARK